MPKRTVAQKVEAKGSEEDREFDGRTVLREIWKEWGEMENNSKRYKELETV